MNECIGVQCEEYPLLLKNRDVRQEISRLRQDLAGTNVVWNASKTMMV